MTTKDSQTIEGGPLKRVRPAPAEPRPIDAEPDGWPGLPSQPPVRRACAMTQATGRPCRARPLHGRLYCLLHDPKEAEKVAEARRLGGIRRRHESTLGLTYDVGDLDTGADIRRLLQIVVVDALSLEPGVGRLRILLAAADAASKLLETSELIAHVAVLETVARREKATPPAGRIDGSLLDELDR